LLAFVALQYTTNALKNERILAFQNKGLEEKLVNLNQLLEANL